jgi:hypothetical protein
MRAQGIAAVDLARVRLAQQPWLFPAHDLGDRLRRPLLAPSLDPALVEKPAGGEDVAASLAHGV